MKTIIVTGSAGLIGSEAACFFHAKEYSIIGLDNNMRQYFFGPRGSTSSRRSQLEDELPNYHHIPCDIRDTEAVDRMFRRHGSDIVAVIHTAAQPSHDWAAKEPMTDFTVNAVGTLNLLEATRRYCPAAVFIFTSTNKVYGDRPNMLPLIELETRWELPPDHPFAKHGIDETMSIDNSLHSVFGTSKLAADVMVQEYGKYFGMKTVSFRGGCLTGPTHSGVELHGFLSYLVLCAVRGDSYTIFGHKGKQVRDNIHSKDLISAFWYFFKNPKHGEVYNMGGSRHANVSVLEAIRMIEDIGGYKLRYTVVDKPRIGDHIWYISDVGKFKRDFPGWHYEYDIRSTLTEMIATAKKSTNQNTRRL